MTKVRNQKQFEKAIDEYVAAGITDPRAIARLLDARGCICAAVAVEIYLLKKGVSK